MPFSTYHEARQAWESDKPMFEAAGIYLPQAKAYAFDGAINDPMALDAVPSLATTANAGVPAFLTTLIDPDVFRVMFAPVRAAEIFGEVRKGSWTDQTAMFPIVEQTGEVSSYGDYNTNGRAGANMNWPQRQSYLFQTMCEYGDLEVERAGLGKINWVSEVDGAATQALARFSNYTYFFGVQGLQNYGLLNDPNLSAALTPATKAYGGVKWVNAGQIVATANEIYADIQALWIQIVSQTAGITQRAGQIDQDVKMTLGLPPTSMVAMTATNSFGVNVEDLLKKNFPNLRVVSAAQYGTAAGNLVQLIIDDVEGQDVGYCAFNEKLRTHPIVRAESSYKKKMTSGTWGAIIRMPAGIAQMLGV